MAWPQQPVVIATGYQSVPLIAWLPNGELLFWYEQGAKMGAYWLAPQGRAVYVDFAEQGAPESGATLGHAAFLEPFSATSYLVRLAAPGGSQRITHNVRIDNNLEEFPTRPTEMTKDADSLREATRYAAAALQFFACTAARGATGEVRLTFDWACSSQVARLSQESELSQWPVMLEPLTSSLALVCPGSSDGAAPIPFGQCVDEMAAWGETLVASALQSQRQAERFAEATLAALALTPATEQAQYIPGILASPAPTSTLGAPGRLNAVGNSATETPSPVPTGAGLCGWLPGSAGCLGCGW